jgi:hypothetical protein
MAADTQTAAIYLDNDLWKVLEHLRISIMYMEADGSPKTHDLFVTQQLTRAISLVDLAQWEYVSRSVLKLYLAVLLDATDATHETFKMMSRHPHGQDVVDILILLRIMLMNPGFEYYTFRYPEDGTRVDLNKMHRGDFTHHDLNSCMTDYTHLELTALLGRLRSGASCMTSIQRAPIPPQFEPLSSVSPRHNSDLSSRL